MTMGEIADYLHFNDQSALTNFFKTRAGMTHLLIVINATDMISSRHRSIFLWITEYPLAYLEE